MAVLQADKRGLLEDVKDLRMKLVRNEPEMVTEIDKDIGKLRVKLQRANVKHEHLSSILVEVQTGVSHFSQRFESIQIESEQEKVDENNFVEVLKKLTQKAKTVYHVIERNRHFNELCKSKVPLVHERDLIDSFANSLKREVK